MALWLIAVTATVLPARDPEHVALWRAVAAGFLAYAASCAALLARGARPAWLRPLVLVLSTAAIGAGLFGIGSMLQTARSGGHYEGYVALMGVILCAHGLGGVLYAGSLAQPECAPAPPGGGA